MYGCISRELDEPDDGHDGRDVLRWVDHRQGLDPVCEEGAVVAGIGKKHATVVGMVVDMGQPHVVENLIARCKKEGS